MCLLRILRQSSSTLGGYQPWRSSQVSFSWVIFNISWISGTCRSQYCSKSLNSINCLRQMTFTNFYPMYNRLKVAWHTKKNKKNFKTSLSYLKNSTRIRNLEIIFEKNLLRNDETSKYLVEHLATFGDDSRSISVRYLTASSQLRSAGSFWILPDWRSFHPEGARKFVRLSVTGVTSLWCHFALVIMYDPVIQYLIMSNQQYIFLMVRLYLRQMWMTFPDSHIHTLETSFNVKFW